MFDTPMAMPQACRLDERVGLLAVQVRAERTEKTPLIERRFFTTGAVGRNRTGDLRITNALLYQLSYNGEKQRAL